MDNVDKNKDSAQAADDKVCLSDGRGNRCSYKHKHEHGDCCGHDHKHEHGDCCGHDHKHEHGDCCGHDHKHEHGDCCGHDHKHEHGDCCGHNHEHDHGEGCACCAAKGHVDLNATNKLSLADFKIPLIKIGVSAVLTAIAAVCQFALKGKAAEISAIVLYCVAYLVVGFEYIVQAVKGVAKGDVFNENMLMTVASIGAMALGEYVEGVAVMLLYCIGEILQDAAIAK